MAGWRGYWRRWREEAVTEGPELSHCLESSAFARSLPGWLSATLKLSGPTHSVSSHLSSATRPAANQSTIVIYSWCFSSSSALLARQLTVGDSINYTRPPHHAGGGWGADYS